MTAAIVLAGGRSSRLGVDKSRLVLDGVRLLDATVRAAHEAGCTTVVVVGPADLSGDDRLCVREDPAFAGPVAALEAGLRHIDESEVLVLPCDVPAVASAVTLLGGPVTGDGVVLIDRDAREQWMLARYRTAPLRAAIAAADIASGPSLRSVVSNLDLLAVFDEGFSADVDWPIDLDGRQWVCEQ